MISLCINTVYEMKYVTRRIAHPDAEKIRVYLQLNASLYTRMFIPLIITM